MALGKTVKQLLSEIDSAELTEWFAYYSMEPFGEHRADMRAGLIASVMTNAWARRKGQKPYKPTDFLLYPDPDPQPPQSQDQMLTLVEQLNAAFGGQDLREG